ncbi:hypothetical protein FHS20_001424 [Phyllobacterium endophyticum]|jgi:hypothetical protein|uniref:Uncharacterized protein n=1 Tax=Phyllobacterium endophyticum TaxID=1149773 RepID=A0A2P7AV15_9HYPH|nr:hypothetical protein [Phyllobacterium endophyticum]PSH58059.1 hypothetical protein CU100_10395 [Phyllobacterium endophyticum]
MEGVERMITITKDTSSSNETNVLKMAQLTKAGALAQVAKKLSEPCDKRTISQILRESNGGFSFRR